MNIYEWGAVKAFRRGERKPLSELLKNRDPQKPLSPELYKLFLELVEGKTGRPRGRPANFIMDEMFIAYKVGVQIRKGLRVKEAINAIAKERGRSFSYVKKAHQTHRQHTAAFFP